MNYVQIWRVSYSIVQEKTLFVGVRAKILLFWGFVQKYYCPELLSLRCLFRGCAEILVLGRNIHLWLDLFQAFWITFRWGIWQMIPKQSKQPSPHNSTQTPCLWLSHCGEESPNSPYWDRILPRQFTDKYSFQIATHKHDPDIVLVSSITLLVFE